MVTAEPTSRMIDEQIHVILGYRLFAQEEMKAEAEQVWQSQPQCQYFLMGFHADPGGPYVQDIPSYSTSIEQAWKVVEKLRDEGATLVVGPWASKDYKVTILDRRGEELVGYFTGPAPRAICLVALNWRDIHQRKLGGKR